jgi:hypothetical protein
MRRSLVVLACLAAVALVGAKLFADPPRLTEEEIEAQLKEARKRVEAARVEERALQKRLEEARAEPRGQILAEVSGVLCWQAEGGFYVRVRSKNDPKREIRVWLVVTEDKFTAQGLRELRGKDIVVKGALTQRPTNELSMDDYTFQGPKPPK